MVRSCNQIRRSDFFEERIRQLSSDVADIVTVGFWGVETTVFDPASVFLNTH